LKNPFRTRYRIVELPAKWMQFVPEVWRWYWPFWTALNWTTHTGHDYSPVHYDTLADARIAIERARAPANYTSVTVHEVP
jgi:hypothetical protein